MYLLDHVYLENNLSQNVMVLIVNSVEVQRREVELSQMASWGCGELFENRDCFGGL